jgi:hypothetical protein
MGQVIVIIVAVDVPLAGFTLRAMPVMASTHII